MNNADHPIWSIIRMVVILVAFIVTAQICYQNKLSTADIVPLLTLLLSVVGVDITKTIFANRAK